jgi:hypothetical protein
VKSLVLVSGGTCGSAGGGAVSDHLWLLLQPKISSGMAFSQLNGVCGGNMAIMALAHRWRMAI